MDEKTRERITRIEEEFSYLTLDGSRVKQLATEEFNLYNAGLNHVLNNPMALNVFLRMYETTLDYLEQIRKLEEGRDQTPTLYEALERLS